MSELYNAQSELSLLGNIINNMDLISQYNNILVSSDFSDSFTRSMYDFLCSYYQMYGTEINNMKINNFACEYCLSNNKLPIGIKELWKNIVSIKQLGIIDGVADSEQFRTVKKYAMLRKLESTGYNVDNILNLDDFYKMTADDIANIVYQEIDSATETRNITPKVDMSADIVSRAFHFLEAPEIGLQTPFEFINSYMHGLCKNDFTLIGATSNSGKGRLLMYILVYLVCVDHKSVFLMSNEMTQDDFFKALVCTIVNMPMLQEMHGQKCSITQSDIVQSRFKDASGEYINRVDGEDIHDFERRLLDNSPEYAQYVAILQWFQDNYAGCFMFKNITDDYSIERLKNEIRVAKQHGCDVIAYDTLKNYKSTEWGDMVQIATDLSEIIKNDSSGIVGIATFQLTDDVNISKPEDLNSMKIATAKHIMHVADNMLMFMHLDSELRKKYQVLSKKMNKSWGEDVTIDIPDNINMSAFRIVKNRRGGGKDKIFAVQNNLNLNRWEVSGLLVKRE